MNTSKPFWKLIAKMDFEGNTLWSFVIFACRKHIRLHALFFLLQIYKKDVDWKKNEYWGTKKPERVEKLINVAWLKVCFYLKICNFYKAAA